MEAEVFDLKQNKNIMRLSQDIDPSDQTSNSAIMEGKE